MTPLAVVRHTRENTRTARLLNHNLGLLEITRHKLEITESQPRITILTLAGVVLESCWVR